VGTTSTRVLETTVDVRPKLEPEPGNPRHFLTEVGIGYRFEP
jgi:hypothetical protein